jgi:uncharacterized membrane protein YGL010W
MDDNPAAGGTMSSTLKSHFADYAAFHATPGNRVCHMIGIPLIVLTLLALLAQVPLLPVGGFTITLAEVLLAGAMLWYFTLDVPLAAMMLLASALCLFVGRLMSWPLALGLFVVGWILQFIGHYVYEKKSPAFYRNAAHLLVGPLWILAKASGRG